MRLAIAVLFCCVAMVARADPALRLTSNVIWSQSDPWFGGFSGAEVSENGAHVTFITDKGSLVTATMIRANGALKAMQMHSQIYMTDANGTRLQDDHTDAEGLAINDQGQAFVSFEHSHRVARLDVTSGRITDGLANATFANLQPNSGLEALAIHPNGTLFALPERSGTKRTPFPLFTRVNKNWTVTHHIPRRGPFLAVGADFDEGGRFYLLERAATPLGFRSRIRRFDFAAPNLGEETLLTTGPGRFDNLEALSVWQDTSGQTHLTLISDDNFLSIQRTQIVEFTLTE